MKADPYKDFKERFKLLMGKQHHILINTLSNIFSMRLIGNKTHGDLAEIGIVEFINQFMYDFRSKHVGKEFYRSKLHEEDIVIINELTKAEFPVSLKAYGDGPLQLSTDKNSKMFPYLESLGKIRIEGRNEIKNIFKSYAFSEFGHINVMPLIYDEGKKRCNIMVFDHQIAIEQTISISRVSEGKGRIHPVYIFYDKFEKYICEVRYGGASANALQRGLWTNTKRARDYFESLTDGWIDYSYNFTLVRLFSLALNATEEGHAKANEVLQEDIDKHKIIK